MDFAEGFKFSFHAPDENVVQSDTLKSVAGVVCQQCGSSNLGLKEETLLYCKQCHTEVKEHALNAKTEFNAA